MEELISAPFYKSNKVLSDKIILYYTDAGSCVFIKHLKYEYLINRGQWMLQGVWFPTSPAISTDVRSTDFPGPVGEEVVKWIESL